ncbi:ribonuclease P protein component [Candidatus Falkowbacteria bacterium]|nr:ribonuclease P protein component [Candidatus Falkowbacteria bacterium]
MLKKKYKVAKKKVIEKIHTQGKSFMTPYFVLKSHATSEDTLSRFGITISSKVHKSAVKRNRIKRIIFGYLAKQHNNITPNLDIMIIVSRKAINQATQQVERKAILQSLEFALTKTHILNN